MSVPLFLIPILAGLAAQAIKPWLNRQWYAQLGKRARKIPRYGGMPSAHMTFATSLLAVVGIADGIMTTSFAIAAAIWILLFDDALRLRIFLGRYGQALHQLIAQLPPNAKQHYPYIEPRLGHTPAEAAAGIIFGLLITLLLLFLLQQVAPLTPPEVSLILTPVIP